jgi:predicted CoA-binding protein
MDFQLEKLELIKLLVETDDREIISAVKNIFNAQKKEVWMQLSTEEQEIIEIEIHEANRGDQVES